MQVVRDRGHWSSAAKLIRVARPFDINPFDNRPFPQSRIDDRTNFDR